MDGARGGNDLSGMDQAMCGGRRSEHPPGAYEIFLPVCGPLGVELIVILAVDQHDRQGRRAVPEFEPGARFTLPLTYR